MYADDITQIITSQSKSKQMMKIKVEREIERINRYEKMWKIKTNEQKFTIIPIAQQKTKTLTINGKNIETKTEGTLLGLKLQSRGLIGHATERIHKGKYTLSQLWRFSNLTPEIKIILVKTLLIPVLEYPPIPLVCITKTQKLKMQIILNKALRFVFKNTDRRLTVQEMHKIAGIVPINITLHEKASRIWEAIRLSKDLTYQQLTTPTDRSHFWFPRSNTVINAPPPDPIFTSTH